ncbi:MAG: hypothetical protein IKY91_08215, partial [Akkermansia sp.]|nr:hypothetical protein [Akkermansia sp.]
IKQGVDIVMSGSGTQYLAQLAEDTGRIVTATSGTLVLGQIGSAAKLEAKDGATIVLDGGVQVDTNDSYRWGQNQVYYRAHYEGTDTSNTELVGNVVAKGSDTAVVKAQGNPTGTDGVVTWFDASTFSGHTIEVVSGLLSVYDPTKNGAATDFGTVQTIVLDGGGLVATSPWHYGETDPQITIDTDIEVRGTGYVRCMGTADSTYITTLSGAMTGSGTLVKTDGGTLVLAGDMSDYKGTLKVEKGRLKYAGTGFKSAVNQANDTVLEFAEDATITAATWQNAHLSVSNGAHVSMEVGNELLFNGNSPTFEFSDDGVLAYDGRMRITNATLTLQGAGTYELAALVLSADGGSVGNVEIGAGSTLHITGTSMNVAADTGSFLLSNWSANNTVNIHGTLIMEAGLSNRDGTATVNVKDGGVLQFNRAMEGIDNATQQGVVTINVESGAAVKVGGSTGNSANHSYVVNLADATSVTAMGKGATVAMNLNVAENATAVLSTDFSGMVFNSTLAGAGTYEKKGSGIITLSSVSNLKITEGMVKAASGGLNISGALTMNGGSFYYEGRTSGESTVVDLVTASSYNGNLSLAVSDLAAGKYDLFQGATGLSAGQVTLDANLGRGKAATLSVTNGLVSITVTGSGEIANLVWDTASGDDTWAYGSTNWKNSGEFYASDNVTFADAGETVKVESDIKAGTINVTGDNYVLSGKGTVSSSSFTLAAGKTFSLNTSGNNLGNITLEDGATLNLGVASKTDIGAVIGGGTLSLQGAANINITAGDFTWNRTVSGDNAKLTLIVSNGANVKV